MPNPHPGTLTPPETEVLRLPNFLCIGAMRCGTTTLWDMLSQHPRIFLPEQKELHFFDNREGFWDQGTTAYAAHFLPARDDQIRGESTPCYMFYEEAAERIHHVLPDIPLIVILRDPVARLRSHYWFVVRRCHESLGLPQALDAEPARLAKGDYYSRNRYSYVARGRYIEQLKRFERLYGRDRLCVVFLEELMKQPDDVMNVIFRHIGVEPLPPGAVTVVPEKNKGGNPRNLGIHRIASRVREWSGDSMQPHKRALRKVSGFVRRKNMLPSLPSFDPQLRARVEAEFRDNDRELEEWLGRPLPWKKASK